MGLVPEGFCADSPRTGSSRGPFEALAGSGSRTRSCSKEDNSGLSSQILQVRLHGVHVERVPGANADGTADDDGKLRFQPLPPDICEAIYQSEEADKIASTPGGLPMLLQVCPEKDLILAWIRPPGWQRHTAEDANMTLGLKLSLTLASAGVVDSGARLGNPSTPRLGAVPGAADPTWRSLVAVLVSTQSDAAALQALQLGGPLVAAQANPDEDMAGTWLFETETADEQFGLLTQLQRAGCVMHDIQERYNVGELVGIGASSKVFLAEDITTGEEVAVKIVNKRGLANDLALLKEATILRWAAHDNILAFRGIYDIEEPTTGQSAWALITDFVGGGELFEEVRQNGALSEGRACYIIGQLLSALNFLHHRGIVHRDIKTENVCKSGWGDDIKLVDFGLATPEWDTQAMLARCGSPGYIAPEVLRGDRYGCKVDCFSVGVLMYILLVGHGPFRGNNVEEMLVRNCRCHVSLRGLAHCTPDAKDLVSKLLKACPADRPTSEQGQAHPWMKDWDGMAEKSAGLADDFSKEPKDAMTHQNSGKEKKNRRRLFSVQLGCSDMFFGDLRFAETTTSLDNIWPGAEKDDATPTHASLQMPSLLEDRDETPAAEPSAEAGSGGQQEPATDGNLLEFATAGPARPPPTNAVRRRIAAQCANRKRSREWSAERLLEEEPRNPHQADEEAHRYPDFGAPTPQFRSEFSESQPPGDDEEPRVTVDMCRTCEPIWADVQRSLSTKREQGILPAAAGLKNVRGRLGIKQGVLQRDEENERKSAYFTRDVDRKLFVADDGGLAPQRATAFFHRDLGLDRHSGVLGSTQAEAVIERPSLDSGWGDGVDLLSGERPSFEPIRPVISREDWDVQRMTFHSVTKDEERTSMFFTRKPQGALDEDEDDEDYLPDRVELDAMLLGDCRIMHVGLAGDFIE